MDWLTYQARYVRGEITRRTMHASGTFTMSSLSQALLLEYLPFSHSAFQGHAAHIVEWSAMLRPNGSWGTCIPQGVITFFHTAFTAHSDVGAEAISSRLHAIVRRGLGQQGTGLIRTASPTPILPLTGSRRCRTMNRPPRAGSGVAGSLPRTAGRTSDPA